jgi:hypothetical protein
MSGIYLKYAVEMASDDIIVLTKFHEDWYRHSSNIKVLPQRFEWCNVGINDLRNL